MLFADLTHPSTLAVLLIEAALVGLACAAAFGGALVRPVRLLARGLAAPLVLLGLGFGAGMAIELVTVPLPFVVPDAPLGTYAQMTQLGLLLGIVQFSLTALGAALAFRRPGLGGLLLVLVGSLSLLDEARMGAQDPTLPPASLAFGVLLVVLDLAVGALLLGTWRAGRRPSPTAPTRPSPRGSPGLEGPRPRLHPR